MPRDLPKFARRPRDSPKSAGRPRDSQKSAGSPRDSPKSAGRPRGRSTGLREAVWERLGESKWQQEGSDGKREELERNRSEAGRNVMREHRGSRGSSMTTGRSGRIEKGGMQRNVSNK